MSNPIIVFVDDEPQSRKYFALLCPGQTVVTAADGQEALAALREHGDRVRLVVADQRIPGRLGHEILADARRLVPTVSTILTTGYSDVDGMIRAVNAGGVRAILTKPWDIPTLREALQAGLHAAAERVERAQLLREKLVVRALLDQRGALLAAAAACRATPWESVGLRALEAWTRDGLRPAQLPWTARDIAADEAGVLETAREWHRVAGQIADLGNPAPCTAATFGEALAAAGLPAANPEKAALPIPDAARSSLALALSCIARAFGAYATTVALDARSATLSIRAPASGDRSLRPALLHDPDFVRAFPLYVLGALHGFAVQIDCGPHASEATLCWALDGARIFGDSGQPNTEIQEAFWSCAAQLWQDGTADAAPIDARATRVKAPDRLQ